jgi:hypothetical protein
VSQTGGAPSGIVFCNGRATPEKAETEAERYLLLEKVTPTPRWIRVVRGGKLLRASFVKEYLPGYIDTPNPPPSIHVR